MGYRVRYPTYTLDPLHCVFHGQQVHASSECLFVPNYNAPFQARVGKVIFDPDMDAARELPSQKSYTKCIFTYSALVNLDIFIVATVHVVGNRRNLRV
jgi:hypothetical protein